LPTLAVLDFFREPAGKCLDRISRTYRVPVLIYPALINTVMEQRVTPALP